MVRILVACGTPQDLIARQVPNPETNAPIDGKTLRRAFRAELVDGMVAANAMVAQSLFKKATGNGPQSVTAAIFWAKTRMGWKEPESGTTPTDSDAAKKLREAAAEMRKLTDAPS